MKQNKNKQTTRIALIVMLSLLTLVLIVSLTFVYNAEIFRYTTERQETICYITETGEKYHSRNCQYLRQSCIQTTVPQAIAAGYTQCSKCTPNPNMYIAVITEHNQYDKAALYAVGTVSVIWLIIVISYFISRNLKNHCASKTEVQ